MTSTFWMTAQEAEDEINRRQVPLSVRIPAHEYACETVKAAQKGDNMTSTISAAFSQAVEASFAHMRSHGRTERNQDDFDAGIAVLVELTSEVRRSA